MIYFAIVNFSIYEDDANEYHYFVIDDYFIIYVQFIYLA